jgi:hypothetical protein
MASPGKAEREAEAQFASIDRDARAVCDEGDPSVFVGSVSELVKATDSAIAEADRIDRRLETLRDSRPKPRWKVATMARAGSLYDCIRGRVARATPGYFTAKQQALLNKLNKLQAQIQAVAPNAALQAQIQTAGQTAANKWASTRELYLKHLAQRMIPRYVTAALLARRYALEGFDLTRARWRLPVVAREVGPETMTQVLRDVCDPTASEATGPDCRHVEYLVGAFD